ncbi:MAG: hypothetical protein KGY99_01540 [Phycisphaerae bacterium]|nr:hypothetical protein [Phycisphaerae bacterium]
MRTVTFALATVVMLTSVAGAQPLADAAGDAYTPWVGQVTARDVNVRSSPTEHASYECLRLSRPAKVTVVGEIEKWLKIQPPAGAFSIISNRDDLVRAGADGKTGTVVARNVNIRAGTRVHDWGELANHWHVQTQLDRGDKIVILAEKSDFYRIKPPAGVHFYITRQYVKRADRTVGETDPAMAGADAGDAGASDATTGAETAGDTGASDATTGADAGGDSGADASVVTDAEMEDVNAALKAFNNVEETLYAEFAKPPAERDLRKLLTAYRRMDAGEDSFLKPYIDSRIRFLQIAIRRRAERQEADELIREARRKQKEFESSRAKIEVLTPKQAEPDYVARGVLVPSAVFRGGGGRPKRYVVRNPDTLAIRAYAQCSEGTVAWTEYVGKEVGLVGEMRYDEGLEVNVVEVGEIVALSDDVTLTTPPEPTVAPYTPPAEAPSDPGALPRPIRPAGDSQSETEAGTEGAAPAEDGSPIEALPPIEIEPAETEPIDSQPVEVEPVEADTPSEAPGEEPDEDFAPIRPDRPDMAPAEDNGGASDDTPADDPLPPTGLPVGAPTTQPDDEPINEEEFE